MKCQVQIFNYVVNSKESEVDIYIDGDIVDASTQQFLKEWWGDDTTTSFKSFRDQVNKTDSNTYNVYINSGGGLVTDAMAIHDLLKDLQSKGKKVNTIGRGIIASAATYILMAGDNATMSKNSWLMIHNVSGGVWGDVNTVESYATTLRKFNDSARDFYARTTGMRKEDITKMMNAETWMTADEAKEKGFIKQIEGDANFTNKIPKEHWQFSNMAVLNAYNSAVQPPKEINQSQNLDEMKKFFQELGDKIMNAIGAVKAPENNDHTALMKAIGEAVSNTFKEGADEMEKSVKEIVNEAVKEATKPADPTEDEKKAQQAAEQKAKDDAETIKNLKATVEALEEDIKNIKGGKQTPPVNGNPVKVQFGSFETK
ncbi:MAG TPA: ATP-dependent Clp protease proteolytic subunit [Gammaproteobacteria bacterium]|nr:ATP-dependent Clp protease proteolytic subunit [Gammaproteobacteria bacterium]HRB44168.1 ATP-dependent Clp protease proteolytic subunit [Niabella sp.]